MRPDPAVLGFLKNKGEGVVEFLMRAEPNKVVPAHIDVGLKFIRIDRACFGVEAVCGHHQIVDLFQVSDLFVGEVGLVLQGDAQCAGALLQHQQQLFAPNATEPMTA